MPHRAPRPLNALLSVPVTVVVAAALATSGHAQTSAAPVPLEKPAAIVVAIDAGHGGSPDNAHPDRPFDPGTIGPNGLQEKDLTLDVARRVRRLLEDDRVQVLMTRADDSYIAISDRMQKAIDASAALFVSVHFNAYTDSSPAGSLILYPNQDSRGFAQTMSDRLNSQLQRLGEPNNGIALKDDLWVHATMPALTVEGGYLSNPDDAARLIRNDYRDALASAIRDGIEAQDPDIVRRRGEIVAYEAAHGLPSPTPAPSAARAPTPGTATPVVGGRPYAGYLIAVGLLLLGIRLRRRIWSALSWTIQHAAPDVYEHRVARGRRLDGHRLRRHAALERSRRRHLEDRRRARRSGRDRTPLYDDLRF